MSENSSKIGKYQFVAEPFHVDFTGRLTMGVFGNSFAESRPILGISFTKSIRNIVSARNTSTAATR